MTPDVRCLAEKPAHVPDNLVFQVDCFDLPGMEDDAQLAWLRLKAEHPPIFWTPYNGGHWIVTQSDDIKLLHTDHERFSHRTLMIPPIQMEKPLVPIMLDPPEHTPYRRLMMKAFAPAKLDLLEARARVLAKELVSELAPKGECEFVVDFAEKVPISVFLEMMGLPLEDRPYLMTLAGATGHNSDQEARAKANNAIGEYVEKWLQERLARPCDDTISMIAHGEVEGKRISYEDALSMLRLMLGGGLDTVVHMMSLSVLFLARNPGHRRQLVEDPDLIPNAVEELIRRHGLSNTAREIVYDFEHKGVRFAKGDVIQQANCLYGLDEELVEDPLTISFNRPRPIVHAAFGSGPHVCAGSMLARREIKVCLDEWLRKIPDFSVKSGSKPKTATGLINGIAEVELVWKPN